MSHILYPAMVVAGIVAGLLGLMPGWINEFEVPHWLLYLLIIQVGLALGMRPDLKDVFKSFNLRALMLPACTIAGTLSFTFLATLIFRDDASGDIMAVGSGFGYYTLSSMLIGQLKQASVGVDAAAALAAIALLANVVREMIALISCRYLSKKGLGMTAISVAGISSMDVCLPMIAGTGDSKCDARLVPVALLHGLILEVCVPVLVTFFCR